MKRSAMKLGLSAAAALAAAALAAAALTVAACKKDAPPAESAGTAEAARAPAEAASAPAATPAPDPFAAPSDVAAPPADAEKAASGLASKVLTPGTGARHPGPTDEVRVHYTGWTTDGSMFDSSRKRGDPAVFPLNRVIRGWTEGVQLMVEGEKRRLWIPEEMAYAGRPGRPQGMLVFDVELLAIVTPAQ